MEREDYKFKVTEHRGIVKNKFLLKNINDESLCVLDNNPGSNTGLPIMFNSSEEAEHYLAMVDDASDAVISKIDTPFFSDGYALYQEDPNGMHIFSS